MRAILVRARRARSLATKRWLADTYAANLATKVRER